MIVRERGLACIACASRVIRSAAEILWYGISGDVVCQIEGPLDNGESPLSAAPWSLRREPGFGTPLGVRHALKKSWRTDRQSSAKTPATTSVCVASVAEPPQLGSAMPKTTLGILASAMAPEHMGQGSLVT